MTLIFCILHILLSVIYGYFGERRTSQKTSDTQLQAPEFNFSCTHALSNFPLQSVMFTKLFRCLTKRCHYWGDQNLSCDSARWIDFIGRYMASSHVDTDVVDTLMCKSWCGGKSDLYSKCSLWRRSVQLHLSGELTSRRAFQRLIQTW